MMIDHAESLQTIAGVKQPDEAEEAIQIQRARAGDDGAIDWILCRYRGRVVRLAAHILRRSADADDAAQEAFVRAFRNLHKYRGQSRFYTWLYQITVRVCLDYRRLARWSAETSIEEYELPASTADGGIGDVDNRMLVGSLLDRLSPDLRAALVLRELEGLEYEEIARVLEIPLGRVKWRLHAARQQFQTLLSAVMKETERV